MKFIRVFMAAAALISISSLAAQPKVLFKADFENGLSKSWKDVNFTGKTIYSVVKEGSNSVLKAESRSAASGIASELEIKAEGKLILSWRWKIDKTPAGASDNIKKTFDHSARLFVAFKAFGAPKTINYVWANREPVGKTFEHPSSSRSKWIALQSGNQNAGRWQIEERDLLADWKKLFGDDKPPEIVGIGLMTDSDGTESNVTGYYDDLVLTQTK